MALAIFGISNNGLNLVVNLFILMLVVVWLALIVYTYLDAKRRISDPFLVACATIASFFPYIGTAVYAIVRPPEFLEDAHERELEIKAAELRVRRLTEHSCPGCGFPIERNFLRCPECQRRPQAPMSELSQARQPEVGALPLLRDARWAGKSVRRENAPRDARRRVRKAKRRDRRPSAASRPSRRRNAAAPGKEPQARGAQKSLRRPAQRQQRSPSREPDPDPRQA